MSEDSLALSCHTTSDSKMAPQQEDSQSSQPPASCIAGANADQESGPSVIVNSEIASLETSNKSESLKSVSKKNISESTAISENGMMSSLELEERLEDKSITDNAIMSVQSNGECNLKDTSKNRDSIIVNCSHNDGEDENSNSDHTDSSNRGNKNKRKADCLILDTDSDDDVRLEVDTRPPKRLKAASADSANAVKNGLCQDPITVIGSGDPISDDSMDADDPEAVADDCGGEGDHLLVKDVQCKNQNTVSNNKDKCHDGKFYEGTEGSSERCTLSTSNIEKRITQVVGKCSFENNLECENKKNDTSTEDKVRETHCDVTNLKQKVSGEKLKESEVETENCVNNINDKINDKCTMVCSESILDLQMDCCMEELTETQTSFAEMLSNDFSSLVEIVKKSIPSKKGRRGGRRGGHSSPSKVTTPFATSLATSSTTNTLSTPVSSRGRPYYYRGRGGTRGGSISNTTTNTTSTTPTTTTTTTTSITPSTPTSPTISKHGLPKRNVPAKNYREDSPEIEVVSEKSSVPPLIPMMRKDTLKKCQPPAGAPCTALLNILTRPRNMHPVAVAVRDRKELDAMVKSCLVKTQQGFTEWLFGLRLLKDRLTCLKHPNTSAIKLGRYQSPAVLPSSGGYVWMVECCVGGRRYVSIHSGSIFAIGLKEGISATSVLKLLYHWSCQTTISNVENWVKVSKEVIGRAYHYLRGVCSVMLQDKLYDLGATGTTVELGIVSLGTTTADGSKKAVKVEILGLYDRSTEAYRLYASAPQNNVNSAQRFMRILKPVLSIVHHNAVIVCDYSIDRTCLPVMNYKKVVFCNQNQEGTDENSNSIIMSYLRKHVPKMFQNSLSQLSLEQVQLVLDELCWRETFGRSPSHAYTNLMKQLSYLTIREAPNSGLLSLLDFVCTNPHKSWRYVPDSSLPQISVPPPTPPTMHPASHPVPQAVTISRSVAPTVHPAVDVDVNARVRASLSGGAVDVDPSNVKNPLQHENKMVLSIINNQVHPIRNVNRNRSYNAVSLPTSSPPPAHQSARSTPQPATQAALAGVDGNVFLHPSAFQQPIPPAAHQTPSPAARKPATVLPASSLNLVDIVPRYYGEVPGDDGVAHEINHCTMHCHKCHDVLSDNVAFYDHMKTHLLDVRMPCIIMCRYCIRHFGDQQACDEHVKEVHSVTHLDGRMCRICMARFEQPAQLAQHLMERHVEAELPYRCEVCNFATSYYPKAIDHFIEKHRGAPYIQCHYCLLVKVISPGNMSNLSQWLYTHLVEHSKSVRCTYCVLYVKNRKSVQGHRAVHVSYKLRKDLVRYSASQDTTAILVTAAQLSRQRGPAYSLLANPITGMRPAVAMSRLLENTDNIRMLVQDSHLCRECEKPMNTPGHFKSYQSCTRCPYATSCSIMMPRHNYLFHPMPKTRRLDYSIAPPIVLSEVLVCSCGFASHSGNHIAKHLGTCEESTRTAYPALTESPSVASQLPPYNMMLAGQEPILHFLEIDDHAEQQQDADLMCLTPKVEIREDA